MESLRPRTRVGAVLLGTAFAVVSTALLAGCGSPSVPDLTGKDAAASAADLRAAEFTGRYIWERSSDAPGKVLSQDPAPGGPDPADRVVNVTVSSGTPFSPVDAVGSEWQSNVPGGASNSSSDNTDNTDYGNCSSSRQIDSSDVTSDGVTDDSYTSASGVYGGTLVVGVDLISTGSVAKAASLLAEERAAQSACAHGPGGSSYSPSPDGGVLSITTEYSSASVGSYPALRMFLFVAAASPTLGSSISTTSQVQVAWQQGAYVAKVSWGEVFGQTLPPRDDAVPEALQEIVSDVGASIRTELARSRENTRDVNAAKKALRDVQAGNGTTSASASTSLTRPAQIGGLAASYVGRNSM